MSGLPEIVALTLLLTFLVMDGKSQFNLTGLRRQGHCKNRTDIKRWL